MDQGSYKINAIVHCNHRLLECSRLGKGQRFKRPRRLVRRHEKRNLARGKGITQNAEKVLVFHTFPIKIPMELTHTVVEGWDGGKKEIVKFFRISGKLSQKLARCLALQGVTNRRAARTEAHAGAGPCSLKNSISIKTEDCKDCIRNRRLIVISMRNLD